MSIFSKDSVYRKYFESHTVRYEAFGVLLAKLGYADRYLGGLNAMYKAYSRLNRKFKKYIGTAEQTHFESENTGRIWFCWFQGVESAPEFVKRCLDSIRYHNPEREIVLINKDNFSDYCTLPDYIIEKWEKGIISNAHFSDILRVQLLIENGGIWIDSTVYMTDALPSYITESDFFIYQTGWMNLDLINMGSWLIKSLPNNLLLCEVQNLLFEYWKKYNYLCQYFLLHHFFKMVSDYYKEELLKIPYVNQIDQHLLSREINKSIDEKRLEFIKALTPVHKLTYKLDSLEFEDNSYYTNLDTIYKRR